MVEQIYIQIGGIALAVVGATVYVVKKYVDYQWRLAKETYAKVGAPPVPPQKQEGGQSYPPNYGQVTQPSQAQTMGGSYQSGSNIFPNILKHMDQAVEEPQSKFDALKDITEKLSQKTTEIFSETDQLIQMTEEKIKQLETTKEQMEQHAKNFDAQFTQVKYHLDLLKQIKDQYSKHRQRGIEIYSEVQKEYQQGNQVPKQGGNQNQKG